MSNPIKTKYLGPTNTRGSRISAIDDYGNKIVIAWDNRLNADENHEAAAELLRARMNWKVKYISGKFGDSTQYHLPVFN